MTRLKLVLLYPVIFFASVFGLLAYCWHLITGPEYAWRIAMGYDQVGNASIKGSEDETISSRAGKAKKRGDRWGCVLCRLLDWIVPNHCEGAIELDEGRRE